MEPCDLGIDKSILLMKVIHINIKWSEHTNLYVLIICMICNFIHHIYLDEFPITELVNLVVLQRN